jgi:protocatechuate 3,4-dioxygenase beta subunit
MAFLTAFLGAVILLAKAEQGGQVKSLASKPATQPAAQAPLAEQKQKLVMEWVEDFFRNNYRDITERATIEWGQVQEEKDGNLSIRYKYLATIWGKDKLIIDEVFTFSPGGEFVSAKKLSKSPAATRPGSSQADQAEEGKATVVREGAGYGKLQLGMTRLEALDLLGPPDGPEDPGRILLNYRKSRGIDVHFSGGTANEIRFNKGFLQPLSRGPHIDSTKQEVFAVYGEPTAVKQTGEAAYEDRVLYQLPHGASKIAYGGDGVLFWFDLNDKVSQFVVFRPHKAAGETGQEAGRRPVTPVDESKLPPEQAVAIGPNLFWQSTTWSTFLDTGLLALDDSSGWPKFVVGAPDSMHIWLNYLTIPVDWEQYPVLVMTYRARNIKSTDDYVIWMDDTTGPSYHGICPFLSQDLTADGVIHELRSDLRLYDPKGPIIGMSVNVRSGTEVPAEFELMGLRFEREEGAQPAGTVRDDQPLSLRVVDPTGRPVEGAAVAIDAELANWARSALTDKDGRATLTPLANDAGKHMLRISKPGYVTAEVLQNGERLPQEVRLPPGVRYGGLVTDEEGKPVAGASINIIVRGTREGVKLRPALHLLTDTQGRWETPLLPADLESKEMRIWVAHSDYVSDSSEGQGKAPDIKKLRDGTAKRVLHRGVEVSGVVLRPDGTPAVNVTVRQGRDRDAGNPRTRTDEQGRFRFRHVQPGELTLTVQTGGCAPEVKVLEASPDNPPVEFRLQPACVLRGRVVDQDGQPVEGAFVGVEEWRGHRTVGWQAQTDEQGRFHWSNAPADAVLYYVYKEGYQGFRRTLTASDEEVVLTLPPAEGRGQR